MGFVAAPVRCLLTFLRFARNMEVETASARHRAAGNQLYRTALTFTHLGTRNGKLWKAREAYESAQKSARASADRAKATRNLGVVCAAQQEALPGNDAQLTIRYLVNAIVFGLGALTEYARAAARELAQLSPQRIQTSNCVSCPRRASLTQSRDFACARAF